MSDENDSNIKKLKEEAIKEYLAKKSREEQEAKERARAKELGVREPTPGWSAYMAKTAFCAKCLTERAHNGHIGLYNPDTNKRQVYVWKKGLDFINKCIAYCLDCAPKKEEHISKRDQQKAKAVYSPELNVSVEEWVSDMLIVTRIEYERVTGKKISIDDLLVIYKAFWAKVL